MPDAPVSPLKLYISYAHQDGDLLQKLKVHLSVLERRRVIQIFYDAMLEPGEDWKRELGTNLQTSRIVLFLISPDFLISRNVDQEVQAALELHESRGLLIVPIMLRPCDWSGTPLSRFQALPQGARPVTVWPNQDEAFLDIVTGLQRIIVTSAAEQSKAPETEAAFVPRDMTVSFDRLHVAYLAVLESPDLFPFLDGLNESKFGSALDRPNFERLRAKYPDTPPPPLWTAWMQAVHADKLGTGSPPGDAAPPDPSATS